MRLKPDFIIQEVDGTQFLVPVGDVAFSGMARGNKTAAFIVDCLREETSREAIIDKMLAKYDSPRATIASDVDRILGILRGIDAIEE